MVKSKTKSLRWIKRLATKSSRDISSALYELAMHSGLMKHGFPRHSAPAANPEQRYSQSRTCQTPDTGPNDFTAYSPRHYSSPDPLAETSAAVDRLTNESERLGNPIQNFPSQNQTQVFLEPNASGDGHERSNF